MLSIKQLYKKYFCKNNNDTYTDASNLLENNLIATTIGLTTNYEVDLLLEIKQLSIRDQDDLNLKAQKIASFFYSITSGALNNTIMEIMNKEMSDDVNKPLFDAIIYNWLILEQTIGTKNIDKKTNTPLVPPSKVFLPYMPKV